MGGGETHTDTHRHTQTQTHRQRQRHKDTDTDTETQTHTYLGSCVLLPLPVSPMTTVVWWRRTEATSCALCAKIGKSLPRPLLQSTSFLLLPLLLVVVVLLLLLPFALFLLLNLDLDLLLEPRPGGACPSPWLCVFVFVRFEDIFAQDKEEP